MSQVEKVQLGVRVKPTLKAAIEKIAREERRPLAAQVEIIFEEWLEGRKRKAKAK